MNALTLKTLKWIGLTALSFLFFSFLGGLWLATILMIMIGLHECGHLLAAKYVKIPTGGFYFLPIGGMSFIKENPPEQWKKYVIAYGGPLVGLLLCIAAVIIFITGLANPINLSFSTRSYIVDYSHEAVLLWSMINLFNLLPIYPLDGGRLLAAIIKNKKNNPIFDKFLLILSWTLFAVLFLITKSFIIVVIALLGIRMIGRLEPDYVVKPPLTKKGAFFCALAYIGLISMFFICISSDIILFLLI